MKILYSICVLILLTGCTNTVIKPVNVYPEMPPVDEPAEPSLYPCKFDVPRDNQGTPIKNSNIFVGYDQDNYNCYRYNQEAYLQYISQFKSRIGVVNKQREEWINLNKKEIEEANQ